MAFIWGGLWKCRAWESAPTAEEFEGDVNSNSNITAIDTITHGYFQGTDSIVFSSKCKARGTRPRGTSCNKDWQQKEMELPSVWLRKGV